MRQDYRKQAELLLEILPEVAKQSCFALHGGTAINFFVRNMPRLSVDIDLTYTYTQRKTKHHRTYNPKECPERLKSEHR